MKETKEEDQAEAEANMQSDVEAQAEEQTSEKAWNDELQAEGKGSGKGGKELNLKRWADYVSIFKARRQDYPWNIVFWRMRDLQDKYPEVAELNEQREHAKGTNLPRLYANLDTDERQNMAMNKAKGWGKGGKGKGKGKKNRGYDRDYYYSNRDSIDSWEWGKYEGDWQRGGRKRW